MVASGAVEDYTDTVKDTIKANFAAAAGVDASLIEIRIVAASVRIIITIRSPTRAAAEAVQTTLAPTLASASAATALMPSGFTVEQTPTIDVAEAPPEGTSHSPPPPPESNAGALIGGIVGGVVGGVILLVVIAVLYLRVLKKKPADPAAEGTQQLV